MKKLALLLICSLFVTGSFAQTLFPDGGFETAWFQEEDPAPGNDYFWNYQTDLLNTLNSIRVMWTETEQISLNAFRDENAYAGDYCIRLETGILYMGDGQILIPGALGTINEDFVTTYVFENRIDLTVNVETYFDEYPTGITGMYKYTPVNGDSASFEFGYYTEVAEGELEEIDYTKLVIHDPVDEWTPFELNLSQELIEENPIIDEMQFFVVASAGYDFVELVLCEGQLGTTIWVDELAFVYGSSGLKEYMTPRVQTSVFPNPTTDVVNIKLDKEFSGDVVVYNSVGTVVAQEPINGNLTQLNTQNLQSGNYFFRLIQKNTIFATGKFSVVK